MSTPSHKSKSLKRLSLLQSTNSLPSPSSSSFGSPSVASHCFDLAEQQPDAFTQSSSVSSVCSPTEVSRPDRGVAKNARRQSSIYYVSLDRDSEHATNLDEHSHSNARGSSAPRHDNDGKKAGSEFQAKRTSFGAVNEQAAPMTLVEKHADLLRFIAQKESRCLELRSQLATEEAELQALKRKWERIVNRRVKTESLNSQSSSESEHLAQSNVLAGLKEGVQGVGRLLAQLGDLSTPGKETDHGHASNSSISTMVTSSTRLSQSSMSSLGVTSDGDSAVCADFSAESVDRCAKRHSISTPVRRRPYEPPSSPGTASPPALSPRTPQSASFVQNGLFPPNFARSHSTTLTQVRHMKRLSAGTGSLPPASSIPGASIAPLASWVEEVGKRLIGQVIAGTDIDKRAATVPSNVPAAPSLIPSTAVRISKIRPRVVDLSTSLDSPCLLDDDDGPGSQWTGMTTLLPERPKRLPSVDPSLTTQKQDDWNIVDSPESGKIPDDDGEEWNW